MMALQVVGAGLGRTGTNSLKLALERLLGGACYHMYELVQRPQDVSAWENAVQRKPVAWNALFESYVAAVDWPAAAFWREIHAANPDAFVLLSSRDSAQEWWSSMERTILVALSQPAPADDPDRGRVRAMTREMMRTRFAPGWRTKGAAIAAYERHNADVRRSVRAERLIDWRPGEGWEPICSALGLATPADAFPHENKTADFRSSLGLDRPSL
jgi:hypothetical protein